MLSEFYLNMLFSTTFLRELALSTTEMYVLGVRKPKSSELISGTGGLGAAVVAEEVSAESSFLFRSGEALWN
jgi:hypothetical protein